MMKVCPRAPGVDYNHDPRYQVVGTLNDETLLPGARCGSQSYSQVPGRQRIGVGRGRSPRLGKSLRRRGSQLLNIFMCPHIYLYL